jgi:hypothetical protein
MGLPGFPGLLLLALSLAVVAAAVACGEGSPAKPVTDSEDVLVRSELEDRSFRQFEPNVDGDPRKGVIIDFTERFSLWGQYSEGDNAVNEWEITSDDYRIEKHGAISEVTVYFVEPQSMQVLPTMCTNCIETAGVSISIRSVLSSTNIEFKINDPDGVLPSPFPLFNSWSKFQEDELQNSG